MGSREKKFTDMTSYWVPEMEEKNAPYYQISFLKTNQMDEFVPMNVNPVPNSILRVFLDFKTLNSKPSIIPKPQQFNKFIHHGFTLVEQGGLQ